MKNRKDKILAHFLLETKMTFYLTDNTFKVKVKCLIKTLITSSILILLFTLRVEKVFWWCKEFKVFSAIVS